MFSLEQIKHHNNIYSHDLLNLHVTHQPIVTSSNTFLSEYKNLLIFYFQFTVPIYHLNKQHVYHIPYKQILEIPGLLK